MTYALAKIFARNIGTDKVFIYHNVICTGDNGFKDNSKRCYGLHRFGIEDPLILDIENFTSKYDEKLIKNIDELKYFDMPKEDFKSYKIFMIKFVFTKNLSEYFDKNRAWIKSLFKYQG